MTTLKDILGILESNGIFITEKELAELISHDILVGVSYFKQLRKRDRTLDESIKADREYYENLYYMEHYKKLHNEL